MAKREWNFWPCSAVMGDSDNKMGGVRGALEFVTSHLNPQGKTKIPLGIGDPSQFDCFTPSPAAEDALIEAIKSRKYNGYSPALGLTQSRKAVAEHLSTGLPYKLTVDDICLTVGCRQAVQVSVAVLARKDANILLPRPVYPLYEAVLAYNGIEARYYSLIPEKDWEVDLDQVQSMADNNTVAMVLINPNNPSGAVFSYDHLAKVAEMAKGLGLLVISDEVYAHMVFGEKPFVPMGLFASTVPVLTVGSISKRWLVPGWRLGWLAICDPHGILKETQITEGIMKISNLTVDPSTIVQAALPQILEKTNRDFHRQTLKVLSHAAGICYNRIQKIDVLCCQSKPQGGMFLMVKINTSSFEDITDDIGFSARLAKEESVIVLPGSSIGMKNWIRISFGISPSLLEESWDRIESFCLRHAKTA
eukprot:Gb_40015 [translate_table: standard]